MLSVWRPAAALSRRTLRLVEATVVRTLTNSAAFHKADTLTRIWRRKMELKSRYADWTKEALLSRIAELESAATASRAAQSRIDVERRVASLASASSAKADQGGVGGGGKGKKKPNEFDFASSACRKIALRFSYDGAGYSGLAAQNTTVAGSGSTLPTVEAVLWDALCVARLVDPSLGMDGAGFSRCGRTDRGVSAAAQVVALWVRSKKTNQWKERLNHQSKFDPSSPLPEGPAFEGLQQKRNAKLEESELPYVQILNRILPPTIRVQAWSPVRPDFSSRFDCTYRHYKYFFPAGPPSIFFPPPTGSTSSATTATSNSQDMGATRLDINLMREAAHRLLGEHDFRNLCKIDASKQITNYRRRIDGVSIDRVSAHWPTTPAPVKDDDGEQVGEGGKEDMYVLNLRGTAFLYHQVRNIMAILFLVGARLEHPSVIEELMNTEKGAIAADRVKMRLAATTSSSAAKATANSGSATEGEAEIKWWLPVNATRSTTSPSPAATPLEGVPMWIAQALTTDPSAHAQADHALEVYATKPNYEMAADRPLVLWECGFLPSDIEWRVGPYDGPLCSITSAQQEENLAVASNSLLRVHKTWTQLAISTELTRHFVLASASAHTGTLASRTRFSQAAYPCLPTTKSAVQGEGIREARKAKGGVIPLGNAMGRGAANYIAIKQRPREEAYEIKNQKWLASTGKRRAERKQALLTTTTTTNNNNVELDE